MVNKWYTRKVKVVNGSFNVLIPPRIAERIGLTDGSVIKFRMKGDSVFIEKIA